MASVRNGTPLKIFRYEPYAFEPVQMWPDGIYEQLESNLLLLDNDNYVGFLTFEVADSLVPDSRRKASESTIVFAVAFAGTVTLLHLLSGDEATTFGALARSKWDMDPMS